MPKEHCRGLAGLLFIFMAVFSACSPAPAPPPTFTPTPGVTLTPFTLGPVGATPTAAPTYIRTPTPLPTPTATPYLYTIVEGDTLIAVAFKFGLTLAELLVANPGIDPQFLKVGDPLIIPLAANSGAVGLPTPVGAAIPAGGVTCWPVSDGGLWCFWVVVNDGAGAIEGLAGQFSVYDSEGAAVASGYGIAPLNLVPPGARIPIVAWFPEAGPDFAGASAVLTSAIPVAAEDTRYLEMTALFEIGLDGAIGTVTGQLTPPDDRAIGQVRIALVAFDSEDRVVGVRVFLLQPPAGGEPLAFTGQVYSLAGEIAAVEVLFEAYPIQGE